MGETTTLVIWLNGFDLCRNSVVICKGLELASRYTGTIKQIGRKAASES
jgi:hypothetical protein